MPAPAYIRHSMRHFGPILLAVALCLAACNTSVAAGPAKPRQVAQAKVRDYLAKHSWARSARLGRCQRGAQRAVCRGTVRGIRKSCRVRIVVKRNRAKLRRGRCVRGKDPEKFVSLSAWLGTPGREKLNPFHVTYPHGATATSQTLGIQSAPEPEDVPPGVLALYVDGVLECAENVNVANPEATCPVDYDALGSYRVTTIYTSGSESAADTMIHRVDPIPTSTSMSVEYEPLVPSKTSGAFDWLLGYLRADASTDPAASGPLGFQCRAGDGPSCLSPPGATPTDPIGIEGRQCGASGERNAEPICQVRVAGTAQWRSVEAFAENRFLRVTQSPLAAGYIASEAIATIDITPELVFPECTEEHTGPWC